MSISIKDNLALLAARPAAASGAAKDVTANQAFAGTLDRFLADGTSPLPEGERGRVLAESLSLQMMQTTLSLAGSTPQDAPQSAPQAGSALQAVLKSYLANQPPGAEVNSQPEEPARHGQLQELTAADAVTAPAAPVPGRDAGWLEPIIRRASARYGVDGTLIKAVIKAESNFNPNAVSHAGAQGLMQLMPATARSLGVSDSFDPEQNVMAGTRFLADLLKRYNGDLDSALAAYNWGPGNVDRRPERLPRETREYLVRVRQNMTSYST